LNWPQKQPVAPIELWNADAHMAEQTGMRQRRGMADVICCLHFGEMDNVDASVFNLFRKSTGLFAESAPVSQAGLGLLIGDRLNSGSFKPFSNSLRIVQAEGDMVEQVSGRFDEADGGNLDSTHAAPWHDMSDGEPLIGSIRIHLNSDLVEFAMSSRCDQLPQRHESARRRGIASRYGIGTTDATYKATV